MAETHHRPGRHGALCTYQIPFAHTVVYQHPEPALFSGVRQYYANSLLTVDLLETQSTAPLALAVCPKRHPLYSLSIVLEGCFRFGPTQEEDSAPGSAYLARLSGQQYTVETPSHTGRLISINIHTAQLSIIGEDFAELAALLADNPQSDQHYSPSIQADTLFMRRLIKLVSPSGIERRKDFNQHLQIHLPGVFSAFKGLLHGKTQAHYNRATLDAVLTYIQQENRSSGQPPTLSSVIDFACVSIDKLQQLFKTELGTTPQAYLQNLRMEAVRQALLNTDHPVYAIAFQFGYSDTAALNKPFKKRFGQSPQQLRRQLKTC